MCIRAKGKNQKVSLIDQRLLVLYHIKLWTGRGEVGGVRGVGIRQMDGLV